MKKSDKLHRSRAVGQVKTVIMILLVICMIALMVVYIGVSGIFEKAISDKDKSESFDKLWSVQNSGEQHGLDPENLTPEFIGYKQVSDEYPRGSTADKESLTTLYACVRSCLTEIFGKNSVCRPLSSADGAKRFLEGQASDEFVYIRYHVPVLYQLIYAYASEALTVLESDVAAGAEKNIGAYISDIIILPDKNYAAHRFVAYAADGDGNYYEFRPGDHFVTSNFYISMLAEAGVNTERFAFVNLPGGEVPQPMTEGEVETAVLSYSAVPADSEEMKEEILRLFGFNPNKLNFYSDGEETVYVDLGSRLRIGGGLVSFVAMDGGTRGIEIGTLLEYMQSDESYSLFDKLTAVDNLIRDIREISPSLLGGDEAELCLGEVYTNENLLVIEYFLTYNTVRIDGKPIFRVLMTENTLCEVEINPVFIRATGEITYNQKPAYILRKLYELDKVEESRRADSVSLCYNGERASWNVYFEN